MSDDGAYALTLIAFVGSVFSPYYANSRRRGDANPYNHCALNVALYGKNSNRWSMTERGRQQLRRAASVLSIGNSEMRWTGSFLETNIDEICAPLPHRLRGKIRLLPSTLSELVVPLDGAARHHWVPYAPCSRVEVELSHPALSWCGNAYFDANFGVEPLEAAFASWQWSRSSGPENSTVFYEINGRDGVKRALALRFEPHGEAVEIEPPPPAQLPKSGWGISRRTRADLGSDIRVLRTLENAPFYSRTLLETTLFGVRTLAIHESVELNRFSSRWVQYLLPFRMPRFTL
ncbi:MAG: carotenoid 1,2-hydratase [Pseudomonadota bacterium]|nr:carotenoid 1,2-hydratase [Pseudomonadota bacterium]